jgi:hypothetical protein
MEFLVIDGGWRDGGLRVGGLHDGESHRNDDSEVPMIRQAKLV